MTDLANCDVVRIWLEFFVILLVKEIVDRFDNFLEHESLLHILGFEFTVLLHLLTLQAVTSQLHLKIEGLRTVGEAAQIQHQLARFDSFDKLH